MKAYNSRQLVEKNPNSRAYLDTTEHELEIFDIQLYQAKLWLLCL